MPKISVELIADIGDSIILKRDPNQLIRKVVGLRIVPGNVVIYQVVYADENPTGHYDIEIESKSEKSVTVFETRHTFGDTVYHKSYEDPMVIVEINLLPGSHMYTIRSIHNTMNVYDVEISDQKIFRT